MLRSALSSACREELIARNVAEPDAAVRRARQGGEQRHESGSGYVFTTRTGRQVEPRNVYRSSPASPSPPAFA